MKKQIVHFSVHQTSKVIATLHVIVMMLFAILPMALGALLNNEIASALFLLILGPFVIWLIIYISYAIACWFYNLVVSWTGGIEIELADVGLQIEPVVKPIADEVILNPEVPVVSPDDRDRRL